MDMGIKGEKGVKANSLDSNLYKCIHWTVEGRGQSNRLGHFVLFFFGPQGHCYFYVLLNDKLVTSSFHL